MAFDWVPHGILLDKLVKHGFSEDSLSFIRYYLINRCQYIQLGSEKSGIFPIECGVPQGSILSPFLFILYINDLPLKIEIKTTLFADDSNL